MELVTDTPSIVVLADLGEEEGESPHYEKGKEEAGKDQTSFHLPPHVWLNFGIFVHVDTGIRLHHTVHIGFVVVLSFCTLFFRSGRGISLLQQFSK